MPTDYSATAKENYEALNKVLELIYYDDHKWDIWVGLETVNFLLWKQSSYTIFPWFLCLWDSLANSKHWVQQERIKCDVFEVGQLNIINQPLVDHQKTVFPSLHIKLGLVKQFALNKENDCFKYSRKSFPSLKQKKLKAGIFDGPRLRKWRMVSS